MADCEFSGIWQTLKHKEKLKIYHSAKTANLKPLAFGQFSSKTLARHLCTFYSDKSNDKEFPYRIAYRVCKRQFDHENCKTKTDAMNALREEVTIPTDGIVDDVTNKTGPKVTEANKVAAKTKENATKKKVTKKNVTKKAEEAATKKVTKKTTEEEATKKAQEDAAKKKEEEAAKEEDMNKKEEEEKARNKEEETIKPRETQKLPSLVSLDAYEEIEMPPDGDCFYHAFAYGHDIFKEDHSHVSVLRAKTAECLRKTDYTKTNGIQQRTALNRVETGEWAHDFEIKALCTCEHTSIFLYEDGLEGWTLIDASEVSGWTSRKTIYMRNINNQHFNILKPKNIDTELETVDTFTPSTPAPKTKLVSTLLNHTNPILTM